MWKRLGFFDAISHDFGLRWLIGWAAFLSEMLYFSTLNFVAN